MQVLKIDHINIGGTPQLVAACRAFYVDVLGLKDGHRPSFNSRGFWLYAGENAVVHLTVTSDDLVGTTGPLNHFAFSCVGLAEMLERLRAHEIAYSITEVPGSEATQLFVKDPAGIRIELNFAAA